MLILSLPFALSVLVAEFSLSVLVRFFAPLLLGALVVLEALLLHPLGFFMVLPLFVEVLINIIHVQQCGQYYAEETSPFSLSFPIACTLPVFVGAPIMTVPPTCSHNLFLPTS